MSDTKEPTHLPLRPSFDCATCGEPWPCASARVELIQEYHEQTMRLLQYLAGQMGDAMGQAVKSHDWGRVDNLYDRFLGWVPRCGGEGRSSAAQ
jgi:hypothetical protein